MRVYIGRLPLAGQPLTNRNGGHVPPRSGHRCKSALDGRTESLAAFHRKRRRFFAEAQPLSTERAATPDNAAARSPNKRRTFCTKTMTRKKKHPYAPCRRALRIAATLVAAAALTTACIDEDLSRCGKDYALQYRFMLRTSLAEVLDEELTTPAERQLLPALREGMAGLFSDVAADLSLHFHDPATGGQLYAEEHLVEAHEAGFTLYLPERDYRHTAFANLAAEPAMDATGADRLTTLAWALTAAGDTVPSLAQSLFCGWQDIALGSGQYSFFVPLYMQDAAAVWVVDPRTAPVASYEACFAGTADGFRCADSLFTYRPALRVRTRQATGGGLTALYAGCLPSPDAPGSLAPANRAGEDAAEAAQAYWETHLYVTLADGTRTKNVLYVKSPLEAGALKVFKVHLNDRGEVVTDEREVGVSVTLDWKAGGDTCVEM